MRRNIVHPQADELIYEIRGVVLSAKKMAAAGLDIVWENIGDPVAKGEQVPEWIIEHMRAVVSDWKSWSYSPTQGMDQAREYLAGLNNSQGGVQITPGDIYFYNGLADAVNKLYGYLDSNARVLVPSPCYPIHSSRERFHAGAGAGALQYSMTPENNWLPDIEEIRQKVKDDENIVAITIINPDNPTGAVWPGEAVRGVVEIAGEYGLFVIADEIYWRLTYNGKTSTLLSQVAKKIIQPFQGNMLSVDNRIIEFNNQLDQVLRFTLFFAEIYQDVRSPAGRDGNMIFNTMNFMGIIVFNNKFSQLI